MSTTAKQEAEKFFAAIQTKAQRVRAEIEDAQQERAERAANLRALRLAKEAAEKSAKTK